MNSNLKISLRVLAIDPGTRGFGFVVLEGPCSLVDWGTKEVKTDKHTRSLQKIGALIDTYQPDVMVIEDIADKTCRRCPRVRELLRGVSQLAWEKKIKMRKFSCLKVRHAFSEVQAVTKHEVTGVITARFPELAPWQPPLRKAWMSEDERQAVFDAMAFALTFFHFENNC